MQVLTTHIVKTDVQGMIEGTQFSHGLQDKASCHNGKKLHEVSFMSRGGVSAFGYATRC